MALVLFKPARLLLVVLLGTFFFAHFSHAALPCGNIINDEDVTPITDCEDPFGVDSPTYPHSLEINGELVLPDAEILVPETGIVDYMITPGTNVFDLQSKFYLHDGDDYRLVPSGISGPEVADYYAAATEFFPEGFDAEPYILYLLGEDYSGAEEEGFDFDLLDDFEIYMNEQFPLVNVPLLPGTYTLVSEEILIFQTREDSLFKKIRDLFINTAHAQGFPAGPIYTLTFTLTEEVLVPTGASSVLFLPGIMGSRLYEESAECSSEIEEQERWVSFSNCDQLRLQTNYLGQSLNNIYTYANESSLVDEIGVALGQGPNIYKSFLADLNNWKEEELIADYVVFPYDWRLRIDDLMKLSRDQETNKITFDSDVPLNQSYLYETISRLAQESNNEKVTVVAHSNGGLVIKYFLHLLRENDDPLLERIESVILVAVPQEGTPESIIGTLHGVELGAGGIVMESEVSRTLLKEAPFGFHLLPTEAYFENVVTPVIQIEEGVYTDAWREQFGENINSYSDFRDFMVEESGRPEAVTDDLVTPAVLNSYAFTYKSQLAEVLANWEVPDGVKIYQIAGTGLDTPTGITYFTDIACIERSFFNCIHYERKLGHRINTVLDGDGTVVTPSALSMSETGEVERWWLDLEEYNKTEADRLHRDILEVEDIRDFILDTAASDHGTYDYLKDTSPELGDGTRLIFQLHSPLDMYVVLSDGSVVGSTTESVRGVHYSRFGEVQHLSIPATEIDYVLYLTGQEEGSFSLDIEKYIENSISERFTYSAIPTNPSTHVEFPVLNNESVTEENSLAVDYDGDGAVDVQVAIWSDDNIIPVVTPATTTASSTPDRKGGSSSGTKVGERAYLQFVPAMPLVAGAATSVDFTTIELMKELVIILEQYRDLLMYMKGIKV